jgi:hypothetical protein
LSGSWADVWSVTMSIVDAAAQQLGETRRRRFRRGPPTAACPRPWLPGGRRRRRASRPARRGSDAPYAAAIRAGSTSTHSATPSFIVIASGWAPPIPPSPAVRVSVPSQRAAEALLGDRHERLVGALQDPLGADVDPRTGGHLPVHHQAGASRSQKVSQSPSRAPAGCWRSGPAAPSRGCGTPRPACPTARAWSRRSRGCAAWDDGVEGLPRAGGLAPTAVDDQFVGVLGDLGIEVVHEHSRAASWSQPFVDSLGPARCHDHRRHHCLRSMAAAIPPPSMSCAAASISAPTGRSATSGGTTVRTASRIACVPGAGSSGASLLASLGGTDEFDGDHVCRVAQHVVELPSCAPTHRHVIFLRTRGRDRFH